MWNIVASSAAESRSGLAKKAAGEHLEGEVAGGDGKVDVGQEGARVESVELFIDVRYGHRGQRGRGNGVEPHQVPHPESGGLRSAKASAFHGGGLRQAAEGIAPAFAVDQRIVFDRLQPLELRIGSAQQPSQVVVLPEERVKPRLFATWEPSGSCSVQPPTRPPR